MSISIDSVTGLPDLTSDVYQIPLNTDALPYNDLQAEARLPHQPLLPDDIIPTIALLTALRSDNTGEVVHTDDNHAAKVFVVNQPVPTSAGGGIIVPNWSQGPTTQIEFSAGSDSSTVDGPTFGGGTLCRVQVAVTLDSTSGPNNAYGFIWFYARPFGATVPQFPFGTIACQYDTLNHVANCTGQLDVVYPSGITPADMGLPSNQRLSLYYHTDGNAPWRISATWWFRI